MLGKLIRYDMKSMSRAFIPMWILAPVIALMLSVSIRGTIAWANSPVVGNFMATGNGMVMAVMLLLFTGVMIGLAVMTILFVIQRFWNGLLKDEGYLMFTLPVETWELITSKGITATVISLISVVDGIFACAILAIASVDEVIEALAGAWTYFWREAIEEVGPVFWVMVVLLILLMVLGTAKSIYQAYAAMALGQLFESHRVIGSCVSFVGISVVVSVLTSLVTMITGWIIPDYWVYYMNSRGDLFGVGYLLLLLIVTAVQLLIFHVIAERILSTRLNLE